MSSLNIRIGFSTVTNSLVSRLVRWLTKSRCSHAFFVYFDEDWQTDMVMEASDAGFREIPLATFQKQNTIVAMIAPLMPLDEGLKFVALTYLGTAFDYTGLLGIGPTLLGRWLKRKWHNPWNTAAAVFCSEAVVVAMKRVWYPGAASLIPSDTSPSDLLRFMGGFR